MFTLTLAADQVTPVRAFAALRSHAPDRSSFLLESVVPGERWGRYSIVGYRAQAEHLYPAFGNAFALLAKEFSPEPPLPVDEVRPPHVAMAERFARAMVGYIAY